MEPFVDAILSGINTVISNFGSLIVIPIILFFISLAFKINVRKSFQSALFAGIGLTGFMWLVNSYLPIVSPIVQNIVEYTGIDLPVIDLGWQVTSVVAYATKAGMIYLALGLILQLVMFLTKWTNVFQPSGLWDNYSYMLWGSLVYFATNNMLLAVALMVTLNLWATTFYEVLSKRWSKYYKYPNCTLVQLHNIDAVPFAIFSNWILNKLGANKIRLNPDDLRERMGFLGDPIFLGFGIGFLLGFLGNINRLGTIEGWGSIALVSMGTAAVMAIFPRVASIFAQAFTHLAAASRKFAKSQGREEIYIGVDDASGYGEPATLISGIILIPIILVVAAILPGNKILPLIDLVSIPFAIQAFVSFSNGNIFKVVVSAATWFAGGLLVATAVSPLFSQVYTSVMSDAVTNGSMVASLVIMTKPIWGNFTLLAINYGWVAVGILFVLYWPVTIIFKKNKVTIQNWLEHQAALDMIEEENVGADFDADDEGEAQPITEVAK